MSPRWFVDFWMDLRLAGEAVKSAGGRDVLRAAADPMWRTMPEMVEHGVRESVKEWVHG